MKESVPSAKSLKQAEAQVWAEGQEWMRQRLEQRLQAQAREAGALFPPAPAAKSAAEAAHIGGRGQRRSRLRSGAGKR
jgi:hypothetical protein